MSNWLTALARALTDEPRLIRVLVATVRGSAPREPGAWMLLDEDSMHGSIGGGHLEFKAMAIARAMLNDALAPAQRYERFALGASLGQCCGGAVELWFERFDQADRTWVEQARDASKQGTLVIASEMGDTGVIRRAMFSGEQVVLANSGMVDLASVRSTAVSMLRGTRSEPALMLVPRRAAVTSDAHQVLFERLDARSTPVWLFGAGHVGRALVQVLADLPFDVTWIDSRQGIFPADLPNNVLVRPAAAPALEVTGAAADTLFLVMTHSHDLDFEICRAILSRNEFAWLGLIGSPTKAACFELRLARANVAPHAIARLTCPIGIGGIRSKLPAAIAIGIAAQLLDLTDAVPAPAITCSSSATYVDALT